MQYISAAEAAARWDLTVRRVQDLCRSNMIDGAVRWGRTWMIPNDAHRPMDRRKKETVSHHVGLPRLPKRNPAIIMTALYNEPGKGFREKEFANYPRARILMEAQMAYCQGEIQKCHTMTKEVLSEPCGHDLQLGCGIMLAMCAICTGNMELWNTARETISTAKCHNPKDKHLTEFWLAALDSEIYNVGNFPQWFTQGDFTPLPGDAFTSARYYYLKYLHVFWYELALGHHETRDSQLMRSIPYIAEPLISQTHKEGAAVSEIYLRIVCAIVYHDLDNEAMAIRHLDTAIDLVLPDKLYGLLAEFRHQLDYLMDERLGLKDPDALQKVRSLSRQFHNGWVKLHNAVLQRSVSSQLSTREREIAKLAAFGLSNKDIAQRLHISVNSVKQTLRAAMDKTGAQRRSELYRYI